MITITLHHDEISRELRELAGRCANLTPAFKAIGELLRSSIRQNFRSGGRPTRWKVSARAKAQRGQTLRDTNRLYNSLTVKPGRDQVIVGTNVAYAAAHHFGVDKTVSQRVRAFTRRISQAFGKPIEPKAVTVKAHTRQMKLNLPPRPFMLVQDEDWLDIHEAITHFIVKSKA